MQFLRTHKSHLGKTSSSSLYQF